MKRFVIAKLSIQKYMRLELLVDLERQILSEQGWPRVFERIELCALLVSAKEIHTMSVVGRITAWKCDQLSEGRRRLVLLEDYDVVTLHCRTKCVGPRLAR